MVRYFGDDIKRIGHAFKVSGFAQAILAGEGIGGETEFTTELAALLHDIGIREAELKHHSAAAYFQEMEGPAVARTIMNECGIPGAVLERVCFIVGNHHTYTKIDGTDFQILVEADFLVNVQEGDISMEAVPAVIKKYFRTRTGLELVSSLFRFYPMPG
jgi:predicted HD phosphohydrolase